MALSQDLISQFVKVTKDDKKDTSSKNVNGTVVMYDGKPYVKLDGSDLLTPVTTTTEVKDEDRVVVSIGNHTATVTGNISSPSVSKDTVDEVSDKITKFDIVMAHKVTTTDLEAVNAYLDNLIATSAKYTNMSAVTAQIETLQAKYATLTHITAEDAKILEAEIENLEAEFGKFTDLTAEDLEVVDANITNLKAYNADFTYVSADKLAATDAEIKRLDVEKLTGKDADLKYANIDFSNIEEAAVEKLFTESGIIRDLVMSEGHVTGKLVGVTINGDLIEGNTIKADKLVVLGEDGIYYKLNISGGGDVSDVEAEELQNGLHGSNIIANTITAEKINVDDLVAFDATIGGFNISDSAIYSGVKSSVDNTTRGIYLDKEGQFALGDSSNYLKYYKDENDIYRLEVAAGSIKLGGTNKTVEEELQEIRDEVTTNLRIESSRGTVFKNDNVSTVLSAVIYRGSQRITNITDLRAAMGSSAYLQWKWQRLDETSYGVISASDERLGNNGFTFTLSPEDVDTKVTFMCELITD